MGTVARSVGSNADVLRQRESDLRAALALQHTRVLQLNRTRDELGVLIKDLDSAQRAFDVASARAFQTRIEAQSEQSDIAILNPATAPLEPSAPRLLLNTLAACIIGTVLGVIAALGRELQHRPVRFQRRSAGVGARCHTCAAAGGHQLETQRRRHVP